MGSHPRPLYQERERILYFPILKNATSAITPELSGLGFHRTPRDGSIPEAEVAFALIRDPFRRYLSSLAQALRSIIRHKRIKSWESLVDDVIAMQPEVYTYDDDMHFEHQMEQIDLMPDDDRRLLIPTDRLALPRVMNVTADAHLEYAAERIPPGPILRHYAADQAMWESHSPRDVEIPRYLAELFC